jgi:hypothetical protein
MPSAEELSYEGKTGKTVNFLARKTVELEVVSPVSPRVPCILDRIHI